MPKIILSLASNRYQKRNLAKTRQCLGEILFDIRYTSEVWTEPIGCLRKELYLNQLTAAETDMTLDELNHRLKEIEVSFGRNDEKRKLGIVPIDIDILEYDGERMHLKDWERPYVRTLIKEL